MDIIFFVDNTTTVIRGNSIIFEKDINFKSIAMIAISV